MTDVWIRVAPGDVLAAIDARATPLGLSRSADLRRILAREGTPSAPITVHDLRRLSELTGDLDDPDVGSTAWA